MGKYDKDLALIAQLLGTGHMPFADAYNMYDIAGQERDTRQAERKANLQSLMTSGVEGAIAGYDQEANEAMLSALGQGMGLGDKMVNKAELGLGGLYEGGQSVFESDWDETDEQMVLGLVEQLKTAEGADSPDARARAREVISEYVRKAVGDEDYAKIRSQMHATIDRAWGVPVGMSLQDMAAQATGESSGGGVSSTGDPADNIGWIPDFIEGPANFLTFGGVDNLANAENWGDVGQGLAGLAGGALGVGGLRAISAVPKIGKAASFLGGLGTKPVAAATRNIPFVGPKIAGAAGGIGDVASAATTNVGKLFGDDLVSAGSKYAGKGGLAGMFDDATAQAAKGWSNSIPTPNFGGGVASATNPAKYTSSVADILGGLRTGSLPGQETDDILRIIQQFLDGR